MAKLHVQSFNSGGTPSGSPLTTVLGFPGAITAGNAVFVTIHQLTTSSRTYTVTGSITSTTGWVRHLRHSAGAGGPEIWCHPNHPGGSETISVTHGSGTADFRAMAMEFSGMGGTVTLDASDVFTDGATTTTHYCADAPGVTTSSDVLGILCGGSGTTSTWTNSVASGIWTQTSAGAVSIAAYTIQPTGVLDERGQFSTTGTARVAKGMIAFFTGAASTAPTVTDVTPDTDLPAGGATVTITGTNFVATPAVTFDGVAATGEAWVSATTMTAVVPAHAEGLVTVRVTNPDTQYGELATAFLYDAADIPLPEVLQGPTGVAMVSGTAEIELAGTTAGSRLIGIVIQTDANIRSYGVSDDVNGAYDSLIAYNPARGVYVFEIRDNIGGDVTVTFTKTLGGFSTSTAWILEVSGLRDDLAPVISSRTDSGNTTTHPASAAPGMTTDTYPAFVLAASAISGSPGVTSPADGYTGTAYLDSYVQYRTAASGVLDDQAAWTSANSRVATSVQLAFYASAGEDPDAPTDGAYAIMIW